MLDWVSVGAGLLLGIIAVLALVLAALTFLILGRGATI